MTKDSCQQNNCANTIEYDPIFQTDKLSNKKINNNILTNNNSEKEKKIFGKTFTCDSNTNCTPI